MNTSGELRWHQRLPFVVFNVYCWWFRYPAAKQLRLVIYPTIYDRFEPHPRSGYSIFPVLKPWTDRFFQKSPSELGFNHLAVQSACQHPNGYVASYQNACFHVDSLRNSGYFKKKTRDFVMSHQVLSCPMFYLVLSHPNWNYGNKKHLPRDGPPRAADAFRPRSVDLTVTSSWEIGWRVLRVFVVSFVLSFFVYFFLVCSIVQLVVWFYLIDWLVHWVDCWVGKWVGGAKVCTSNMGLWILWVGVNG